MVKAIALTAVLGVLAGAASAASVVPLGFLPGDTISSAAAVNGDGTVVAGNSQTIRTPPQAFRWTAAGGMVGLGYLPPGTGVSLAQGVSADGSVIVGYSGLTTEQAFRWTAATGMVGLENLPGSDYSVANAANADGSVVVGFAGSVSAKQLQAFRWTAGGGMVGLGVLPGDIQSVAAGVSRDGSVIVGSGTTFAGGPTRAFLWTADAGIQPLWDVLRAQGVDPAAEGWTRLDYAFAVSADGNAIVGYGERNGDIEAFIATVPEPAALPVIALAALGLHRRSKGRFTAKGSNLIPCVP